MKKYCCLLLVMAAASGCQQPGTPSKPAAPSSDAPTPPTAGLARPPEVKDRPKPVPAQLPGVIARVNGAAITRAEFEQEVREFEERAGLPTPPDQRDEVYRGVLNDMVAFRLLSGELKTRSVTLPAGQLDEAMRELRGQFPTNQAFKQALAAQKITAEELREKTRTTLLINQLLSQEVGQDAAVKPGDIASFYEKNPDRFKQTEAVRVSHILIGVPQGAPDQTRAAALARARELREKARRGGDFAMLARRHSNDASRERGGDLGYIGRGQASPAFEQAAFTLPVNEISDVVETPFGVHILKVTDKRLPRMVSFGEAAPQIERHLSEQRRQEKARLYIERLKTSNKVEILI